MRNLFIIGLLAIAFFAFGCSSNPAGNITGPVSGSAANLIPTPPDPPPPPPVPTPTATAGFYGTVSNLSAAGFTLTSPSGSTLNVLTTPETQVLYLGKFFDWGDSPLADGMNVAATATVSGLPAQAKVRATLIVINNSPTNEGLVVFQGL